MKHGIELVFCKTYTCSFVALLDYVSRTEAIKIRPTSTIRLSSVSQLSLNLRHGFVSNFSFYFPWGISLRILGIFEKKYLFHFFYKCLFVFVNIWHYGSKTFQTLFLLQITSEHHTSPEFSFQWSSKTTFFFEVLNIEILTFLVLLDSVSIGHGMGELVRRPSVASIIVASTEPIAWIPFKFNCCFPWTMIPLGHFLNFWKKIFSNFGRFVSVFVNMGPCGRQSSQTLLLLQITAKRFSWISS